METQSHLHGDDPDAELAIPFLDRVLVSAPFPPVAIFLTREFASYNGDLELEVTATTVSEEIYTIKREVERYQFGMSPGYRPGESVYLVMDMYDFRLPSAGTWRFQIKGYVWDHYKRIEVLRMFPDEVTEAVTMEN